MATEMRAVPRGMFMPPAQTLVWGATTGFVPSTFTLSVPV